MLEYEICQSRLRKISSRPSSVREGGGEEKNNKNENPRFSLFIGIWYVLYMKVGVVWSMSEYNKGYYAGYNMFIHHRQHINVLFVVQTVSTN